MISSQIEKLSTDHAAALAVANVSLTAGVNTPLAELVSFSSPTGAAFVSEGVISIGSNNPEHDQAMDNFAQFCADAVATHTNFARNVVTPALEAMQQQAQDAIKAITVSPFMDYQIEEFKLPSLLSDEGFQALLQRFRTNTSVRPDKTLKYPNYPNERLLEVMMFGEVDIDSKIKDLVASLPDGHLQVVWQSVFQNQVLERPTVEVKPLEVLIGDYIHGGNSAVLIFILAYQLSREVTDDVGMDLVPAQQLLNLLCQITSSSVGRQIDFEQANVSTNTLVRRFDERAKKVTVNSTLYQQWLSSGAKPEVLLGLMLMRQQPSTINAIAALADQATQTWASYVMIKQSEQDAIFDQNVRAVLNKVFRESLDNGVVDESERDQLAGGAKALALQLFSTLLKSTPPSMLRENFTDVFWRISCQARYHYSSAYQILSDVDYEVKHRSQDLDDALTIAQNNYVCAFIAEQIMVGDGNQKSSAVTLANAAQLAVEVLMRLPRNASAAVSGNILTRTSAASLALSTIRKKVQEQAK